MATLELPEPEDNDTDNDVPIALFPLSNKRVIGTRVSGASFGADTPTMDPCMEGTGSVLRDASRSDRGRDVQLPCKRRNCPICGPQKQRTKCRSVLRDFEENDMHAMVIKDGGKTWEALHKD